MESAEAADHCRQKLQRYASWTRAPQPPPHTAVKLRTGCRYLAGQLEKIATGTYGQCEECEERIPQARLRAVPGALRCAPCQTAFERRHGKRPHL